MLIWASLPIPFAVPWLRSGLNWYLFFGSIFFRGVVSYYLELKCLPLPSGQSVTGTMTMYAVTCYFLAIQVDRGDGWGLRETSPFPQFLSTFVIFSITTSLFSPLYGAFLVPCVTVSLFFFSLVRIGYPGSLLALLLSISYLLFCSVSG